MDSLGLPVINLARLLISWTSSTAQWFQVPLVYYNYYYCYYDYYCVCVISVGNRILQGAACDTVYVRSA